MLLIRRCILVLIVLFSASLSYDTYMALPWEQYAWKANNPALEYVSSTWVCNEPYSMEPSLESLALENISEYALDENECRLLEDAKNSRANASVLAAGCISEIEYAHKMALQKGMDKAAENIFPYTLASVLLGPAGIAGSAGHIILSVLGDDDQHKKAYLERCGGYESAWERTMSLSMDAFASSIDKMMKNESAARTVYAEVASAGLCDADYAGAGHEECLEIEAGFRFIDSGSIEGYYGQYNAVESDAERIRIEVGESVPDMASYSPAMKLIWENEGVLDVLNGLFANAAKAMDDAENSYGNAKTEAMAKRKAVSGALAEFESERYARITEAEAVAGTVGNKPAGTIAERFKEKKNEMAAGNSMFSAAEAARSDPGSRGYLKLSIKEMAAANMVYNSLQLSFPVLKTSAEKVVSAKQNEAEGAIGRAETLISSSPAIIAVRSKLGEAKQHFSAGKNATLLGDRYAAFEAAASAAREAETLHLSKPLNDSVALQVMKTKLQQMIAGAKMDGIPATYQEELLKQINGADYDWAMDEMKSGQGSLAQAAGLQYGYLSKKRAELLKQIGLIGGDADDLLIDMARAEAGFVTGNGVIDYEKGLGRLSILAATYADIEKTLNGYTRQMAGNSIAIDSEVLINSVSLDQASEIIADLLISNTNQYRGQNVQFNTKLPMPLQLMYSDIVEGKELVASVAMISSDRATIYLKNVEPYAKYRITFETSKTLAHTTKSAKTALGLGDGSASVAESIEFTLDADIDALALPADMQNVKIDGIAPGRQLKKGSHVLNASYFVQDAYDEYVDNMKASSLGLNSQVDYEVVLVPKIDLNSATIYVEPETEFTGLSIFSLTGEIAGSPKKITNLRYSCQVNGLKAGKEARLKVSYILENSSNSVEQALARLDGNYSAAANVLISEARAAYLSGDTNGAIVKMRQAEAEIEKEKMTAEKMAKEAGSLRAGIRTELDEINAALARSTSKNSSFAAKLAARAAELNKRLSDSEGKSAKDGLDELKAVDMGWKDTEVKALKKDAFERYNKLKLRLAAAGNTSTPEEFLAVEGDINKLGASGRLDHAIDLMNNLEDAEKLVVKQEANIIVIRAGLRKQFEGMSDSIRTWLKAYGAEANAARGSEYAPLFIWTEKDVEGRIAELEKLLVNGELELIHNKLDALGQAGSDMEGTMTLLRTQAGNKINLIETSYNEAKNGMEQQDRDSIAQKIESMKKFVAGGQYINALKLGSKIADGMDSAKKGNGSSLLLLGATAAAVLAVLSVYIIRQKDAGKPGKGNKILKKLDKFDAVPGEAEGL